MVDSFLDFIKSLADRSNEHNRNLAELDQEAGPFGSPTQNLNNGRAVVFGGVPVAPTGLSQRKQPIRNSKDTSAEFRPTRKRAPLLRAQRTLLLSLQRAGNFRRAHFSNRAPLNHYPSPASPGLVQVCISESPENGRQTLEYSHHAWSCRRPSQRR